jgi:hypothetical protein
MFIPHDHPSIVLQLCRQPFHLPSASVPAERATILRPALTVATVRRHEFDAALRELRIELGLSLPIRECQAVRKFGRKASAYGFDVTGVSRHARIVTPAGPSR